MTYVVPDVPPRVRYVAAEGQKDFTIPFVWPENYFIHLYVDGVLLSYNANPADNTEYSLVGVGVSTGGTATIGGTGLLQGQDVLIFRDAPVERTTDFQTSGTFDVPGLNEELDRLTMFVQQNELNLENRTLHLSLDDSPEAIGPLPLLADRPLGVLGFDENGDPIMKSEYLDSAEDAARSAAEAAASAAAALTSQNEAASSANSANSSAISASQSADEAAASAASIVGDVAEAEAAADRAEAAQAAAVISQNAALVSENNAADSETAAKASENQALIYRDNAQFYATNAATSENNALLSAQSASSSASQASTSASAAATSESNAAASAGAAATSESNAATSETNAAASAAAAAQSASDALSATINRGTWATATAYNLNDLVQYDGSTYGCILAHTSDNGNIPPNATYWAMWAQEGDQGIQGIQGEKGDRGDPGFIRYSAGIVSSVGANSIPELVLLADPYIGKTTVFDTLHAEITGGTGSCGVRIGNEKGQIMYGPFEVKANEPKNLENMAITFEKGDKVLIETFSVHGDVKEVEIKLEANQ